MLLIILAFRKYHSVSDIYTCHPSTQGSIVFNCVQPHYSRRRGKVLVREIYVRYRVDGKEYQREFGRKAQSRRGQLSEGKDPGSKVDVFYSASDPKFAYLNVAPSAQEVFKNIFYWRAFVPFLFLNLIGYMPLYFQHYSA